MSEPIQTSTFLPIYLPTNLPGY